MKVLRDHHHSLFLRLDGFEPAAGIDVIESGARLPVPVIHDSGKKLYLHSRFDPVVEAGRFISGIDTDKHNLFIVFGLAFAYHVEELVKKINDNSTVALIEKSLDIFFHLLGSRDITGLLSDSRLIFLINPGDEDLEKELKGKSSRNVTFITHRGSHQVFPEYYGNALEKARSYISAKDVNIATLAKFEKTWSSNISRNINLIIRNPGVNVFYGKFRDFPAIVAAAGPSLLQSLDFISANINNMVVIAVDTAFRILMKNGIEPHFCISVDPQLINARYFEGVPEGRTILISEAAVHPSVHRLFRGRVAVTGIAFDIMKWIENITGEKGEISHGGSVSTNACDFAMRIGASPVYLAGQDLAFTGGLAHVRGSYLEEQVFMTRNRLKNELMHNRFQLTALPRINVKGIRSATVHTNHKMMIFLSWFEKRGGYDIINITHDGSYINGVRHEDSATIKISPSGRDIWKTLVECYSEFARGDGNTRGAGEILAQKTGDMLSEIDRLIPVIEKAVEFSNTLCMLVREGPGDRNKMDYILRRLSEADRAIESKKGVKDMVSLTIQRVIHTINEGYEIDEKDSGLSGNELIAKKSLYLYKGFLEGALFNRKILSKMLNMIENGSRHESS